MNNREFLSVFTNPPFSYATRMHRQVRQVQLAFTAKNLGVQRLYAPSDHQYSISLVIDRTISAMLDNVHENRRDRTRLFRTLFVDIATNTRTGMNEHDIAVMREVIDANTMVPRPQFHPNAEITCDLSMVSVITHAAQHILLPTWQDQYNGLRAHLTQLATLIGVVVQNIEERTQDCDNLRNQAIDFATRGVTKTFLTTTIFMKPWFDGRANWQTTLMALDVHLTPIYENPRLAHLPTTQIAPWNLCLFILNGKFAISFAYLMTMTCLFDAWCPHNFTMVQWMTAHHISDFFGNYTVEKQIRMAALFFWLINCDDLSHFPSGMHSDLARLRVRLVHIVTEKHAATMRVDTPPEETLVITDDEEPNDALDMFDHSFPGWRNDLFGPVMAASMAVPQTDSRLLVNPKAGDLPPCDDQLHDNITPFSAGNDAIAFSYYPGLGDDSVDLHCYSPSISFSPTSPENNN